MSKISNSLDILLELQNQSKVNKTSKTSTASNNNQTASFADIWAKVQKQQQEWDQLMDELDIAQYKLALSDRFWSSQADANKHLRNYAQRHQKEITQKNLADVTSAIMHLRQLNSGFNANIDPEMAKNVEKKLQSAMNEIIASTIKTF